MIRFVHLCSAFAWFVNALLWTFYAHVPLLGVGSLLGVGASILLARFSHQEYWA